MHTTTQINWMRHANQPKDNLGIRISNRLVGMCQREPGFKKDLLKTQCSSLARPSRFWKLSGYKDPLTETEKKRLWGNKEITQKIKLIKN